MPDCGNADGPGGAENLVVFAVDGAEVEGVFAAGEGGEEGDGLLEVES